MRRLFHTVLAHWRDPLYRNGYLLMLNSVTGAAFGFLFWLIAARVFDDAAVGYGAAVISAMTLVALLGKFGLDAGLVRYVPRATSDARRRVLTKSLALSAGLSVVFAVAFLAVAPVVTPDLAGLTQDATSAVLFLVFAIAISVAWVFDAYFVAERRAEFSLYRNILFNGLKVALPFIALFQSRAMGIPAAWGVGVVASVVLSATFVPPLLGRSTGERAAPDKRTFMRYCGLNYVQNVSDFLPGLVLPLLVITVLGRAENAYFYVAWTLAFVAFLASKSIAQSTFAEMTHDGHEVSRHMRKAGIQNAIVLAPFVVGTLLVGRFILGLYGPAYADNGYVLLVLLALSSAPVAVNAIYITLLKARNANFELVLVPGLTILLTFLIAYPLLVALGLTGVGIAWLTANALVAVYSGWRLKHAPATFENDPHDAPPHPGSSNATPHRDPAH